MLLTSAKNEDLIRYIAAYIEEELERNAKDCTALSADIQVWITNAIDAHNGGAL